MTKIIQLARDVIYCISYGFLNVLILSILFSFPLFQSNSKASNMTGDLNTLINELNMRELSSQDLKRSLSPIQRQAEKTYNLPKGLLDKLAHAESTWNPQAVSRKGAQGLYQFMPRTAASLEFDPTDPVASTWGAAKYLHQLRKQFGGDLESTLAAYNWGPGNVRNKGLENMPRETRDFLNKIFPQSIAAY